MSLRGWWLRHAIKLLRWSRVLCYVCLALAGFWSVIFPPASIRASSSPTIIYVWAGLLATSALICAAGAIVDRWVGEYVGLVPLAVSTAVFAISALARGTAGIAGAAFLGAFFWIFVSRWQEVALLRVESSRWAERHNGDRADEGE